MPRSVLVAPTTWQWQATPTATPGRLPLGSGGQRQLRPPAGCHLAVAANAICALSTPDGDDCRRQLAEPGRPHTTERWIAPYFFAAS
jgi:hypothetical protein